ncbi:hypothetical protein K458DRAFT_411097 [Lentithecium fluviatile CBS 122367]|uniref:DUF6594 domain-containing protein n=1 Tax=Lentithecium fluviatile CBS 122367 TaxID=1168545 RepID=A0A6G1IC67_9PLEO|nr:hypothetical protein K458DRAFT_411097 [Lentithecium fluviatile CBS 122367]
MTYPRVADVELGFIGTRFSSRPVAGEQSSEGVLEGIRQTLSSWMTWSATDNGKRSGARESSRQVEDNRRGYPRFSALIASHDHFYLCRRFSDLRARILLLKQDRLSYLESQLRNIDNQETEPLRLGSCRADDCTERSLILSQIDKALADYDNMITRNRLILGFETARPQAITSLRNWVAGTRCIARAEVAYLQHPRDLLSIAPTDETVITWLEAIVEKSLICLRRLFGMHRCFGLSRDPKVHIMSKESVTRAARILMTPFIVTLLLAPVIVCNHLDSLTARLVTIVAAASIFIAMLSGSTKAKSTELVVAGATYTTVLIVFITSSNACIDQQGSC